MIVSQKKNIKKKVEGYEMLLMIDNYDSFVYNLVRYFKELGEEIVVYRNDKITIDKIENMNIKGIIISPGPKSPKEAGISLEIIDKFKDKLPILGICLGHQCIGHYFGAEIIKGKEPVHGKISYINHNSKNIFLNVKNPLRVTRYHSLIINRENIPNDLEIVSETDDGVIMAVKHKYYPIYGLQFHPEAEMTEEGHRLLENFIHITDKFREV
jgi:anthranilate synthase/aminodeoxychorismate synthase-like glutamine amidotransferase